MKEPASLYDNLYSNAGQVQSVLYDDDYWD